MGRGLGMTGLQIHYEAGEGMCAVQKPACILYKTSGDLEK